MNELEMFIKFIHEKNIVYNRSLILYLTEYPTPISSGGLSKINIYVNNSDIVRWTTTGLLKLIDDTNFPVLLIDRPRGMNRLTSDSIFQYSDLVYSYMSSEFIKSRYFSTRDMTESFNKYLDKYRMMKGLVL